MAAKGGDPAAVTAYALVLTSLMPGVASTGMVLMSQRVFFAYENVKPVFLMGIGPTIIQVIVGWSMYALTGARWWVVAAALGETACRLTQGIIAVVWVSRENSFVDAPDCCAPTSPTWAQRSSQASSDSASCGSWASTRTSPRRWDACCWRASSSPSFRR